MEPVAKSQPGLAGPPQEGKSNKRNLRLRLWESHRDEIYDVYVCSEPDTSGDHEHNEREVRLRTKVGMIFFGTACNFTDST